MQNKSKISLVMSDINGTLVTPANMLTERARKAIIQLNSSNVRFTLISSRPPYGLIPLAQELHLQEPMVAFNGGMLITPGGKSIEEYLLPAPLISDILDYFQKYSLSPRLHLRNCWLVKSLNQLHIDEEADTTGTKPTIVNDFSPYFEQILKITGVSDDMDAMTQCQAALQIRLVGQASVLCSQSYYLDITHPLANKGDALKRVAELQKIPKNEIAVIGDMPSDVPMFREAGLSIAMGNASIEVKQQADCITDTNLAEGFAKAMEHYILHQATTMVSS